MVQKAHGSKGRIGNIYLIPFTFYCLPLPPPLSLPLTLHLPLPLPLPLPLFRVGGGCSAELTDSMASKRIPKGKQHFYPFPSLSLENWWRVGPTTGLAALAVVLGAAVVPEERSAQHVGRHGATDSVLPQAIGSARLEHQPREGHAEGLQ